MKKMDFEAYAKFVKHYALQRKKAQGEKYRESDFVTGAMCVYFFLGQANQIPASWVFNPMQGIPVFTEGEKDLTQ